MPTYTYRCANNHMFDRVLRVREHDSAMSCEVCDLVAQQIIYPPILAKVAPDVCYDSPVDGRPITSHAARKEDMKRHGAIEYDPEMKKDAARKRRESEERFEAAVEETVCETIAKLPPNKKQQLRHEIVERGLTAEAVRV